MFGGLSVTEPFHSVNVLYMKNITHILVFTHLGGQMQ